MAGIRLRGRRRGRDESNSLWSRVSRADHHVVHLATGLVFYINQILDTATIRAARQGLHGKLQSQSTAVTLATFKQNLCSSLPATMSCSDVIVNLYIVPEAAQPSGYYTYVKADVSGLALPPHDAGIGDSSISARPGPTNTCR